MEAFLACFCCRARDFAFRAWAEVPALSSTAAAREAPREAALSPLRRPMFVLTVGYFWANFERPFLGCIEADFLQVNTKYSLEEALDEI